jgi:hypothetical protein
MFRSTLVLTVVCFALAAVKAQTQVNPMVIGENFYYTKWTDPQTTQINMFGTLYNLGSQGSNTVMPNGVQPSGTKLIRIGGKQFNIGTEKPTQGKEIYYVTMIDECRKNGCEPVITIPFTLNTNTNSSVPEPTVGTGGYTLALQQSIATATTIIYLVNVVHKRNIKYVIIGNEPDIDYGWTTNSPTSMSALTIAQNIAGYVKPLSDAVKSIDPTLRVIAPEYTHCLPSVYNLLFDPASTCTSCLLAGISATSNLPYVDFMSVHFYGPDFSTVPDPNAYAPNPGTSWNPFLVFANLEKYSKIKFDSPNSARRFRGALRYMRALRNSINSSGTLRPNTQAKIGYMVTEMNSSLLNSTGTNTNLTTNNNPSGFDTRSMLGAQDLARMYALCMEYEASSVMMWSTKEGGQQGSLEDRGYLDGMSGLKRGTWFHYQMMSDYFQGTFFRDEVLANLGATTIANDVTTEPDPDWLHFNSSSTQIMNGFNLNTASGYTSNLTLILETKAFAAKGSNVAVMILNHSASTQTAVLKFTNGSTTFTTSGSANFKKFSFNAGMTWNEVVLNGSLGTGSNAAIDGNSTHVIIFDCNGNILRRFRYRQTVEALSYNTGFSTFYSNGSLNNISSSVSAPNGNCFGNTTTSITINNATGPYSWYKLPNTTVAGSSNVLSTSNTHTVSSGIYRTIASGCGTVAILTIINQNSPLVNAGVAVNLCSNPTATLGDMTLPTNQTYTWSPSGVNTRTLVITNPAAANVYTLTASLNGCTYAHTVGVTSGTGGVSLMLKDHPTDNGIEPNTTTHNLNSWGSSDIWVRNSPDNQLTHQNPIQNTVNTVYLRIWNIGCNTSPAGGTVAVFQSKASTGTYWSWGWNNFLCSNISNTCNTAPTGLCGSMLGTLTIPAIPANSSTIVNYTWNTPDNPICMNVNNATPGKWCLLAHLNHPNDQIFYGPAPQYTGWQGWACNNITQRNVDVVAASSGSSNIPQNAVYVRNLGNTDFIRLDFFSQSDLNEETILDYAVVKVYFSRPIITGWIENGHFGKGVTLLSDTSVEITDPVASMENIYVGPGKDEQLAIGLEPYRTPNMTGGQYFRFSVENKDQSAPAAEPPIDGMNFDIEKESWDCAECEENVYGRSAAEAVTISEAKTNNAIMYVTPNPSSGDISLIMKSNQPRKGEITIRDVQGRTMMLIQTSEHESKHDLNLKSYAKGIYFVSFNGSDGTQEHFKILLRE